MSNQVYTEAMELQEHSDDSEVFAMYFADADVQGLTFLVMNSGQEYPISGDCLYIKE